MLLPELINRHRDADGEVYSVADADYRGFGKVPSLDSEQAGANDLLLVDAGMTSADPWEALDRVADGGRVAVAIPGPAADLPMGRIVQNLVARGFEAVDVTELEQVYNRQIAVVGVRGGDQPDAARIRRITWEWACLDLLGRAQAERTRRSDQRLSEEIAGLKGELAACAARVTELERSLAASQQALARAESSTPMRVGKAVIRARRHPMSAARDLSSEIMATRRRKNSKEPR